MRFSSLRAGCALSFLLLAGAAHADDEQVAGPPGQDLYLQALQSIAEGRRADATAELRRAIEQSPNHAGAWLELALTQCALGNSDEAERMFATIETRFDPSAGILELIANAREEGCNRWDVFSSAVVTAGRGVDQNVNQGALTTRYVVDAPGGQVEYELAGDFTPRHDQYTQVSGEYMREVTPNGVLAFAQYQIRHNDRLHQYNTSSLFTGLEAPYRVGAWRLRATGTLGLVTLGGQLYQRQAQLQARVVPPLRLPTGTQLNMVGAITYNSFPSLTNFDSTTQELRSHLSWREGGSYASATLGIQNDHALAQRPGGDRKGSFANLLLRRHVWNGINTELGYSHQAWNSSRAYSPGLIEQVRRQVTQVLRGSVSYAIDRQQSVVLEARAVRNRENISIFQYNNRQLQLSWQWQLP
ncbi:tetratricopeptide repeat protein [Massilia yuzhufengensis]|uniref:Tetratricopeptide repeat-containing protein n=1 Tax=Massilia yuzhufengensis TaxID=1164594 RepID=A0A1I1VQY0_9BURK|nr:tetratricopeptide repeat protein [Massilia yuzhufengensis]SFD85254.1 Tetratricopeptide repeat-containing protein [Massilia yuzhufengensis]